MNPTVAKRQSYDGLVSSAFLSQYIRSRRCARPATRLCYQLIAQPGNKTGGAPPWPGRAQHQMWKVFQIWQTFQIWWYRMLTKQPRMAWGLRCFSRPGAHTPHRHELVNVWGHPINKPYETAALLESSCVTASSPVNLNWSAPPPPPPQPPTHMPSYTIWKIRSSTLI